ncbi:hypothetical protein [Paenibacillus sp. EPM92]|uniref:hypothetical protein n=1 Tax=Paenibacillus sp. EPM92 TaxID=1561195 RepID=UPI0019163B27|nr:hypothetical protein [Paenibacillus sp. EPM92]
MAKTSVIMRIELDHEKISFGDTAAVISRMGGDITSIDVIRCSRWPAIPQIPSSAPESGVVCCRAPQM